MKSADVAAIYKSAYSNQNSETRCLPLETYIKLETHINVTYLYGIGRYPTVK